MFPDPKRLRIGCSGWSYADWVGPFYPKDAKPGEYLHLYSTIFDAVEIDSTYYRTPSPLMVANWRKITTDGFIFSAKFPKKINNELKLRDSQAQLERFYKATTELRENHAPQKDQTQTMKKWYTALEEKSSLFKQGYIFFNNHFAGFGPGSVNEFRRLAGLAELDWKAMSTEVGPLQSSISQFQQ